MRTLLIALSFAVLPAAAQPSYPGKPIRAISGAPPGSPGDVAARIVAEPLGAALGQPVVIEHRVGAMNTIALTALASAAPDGHTIGIMTMPWTVSPHLVAKPPYDVLRDLAPVRQIAWVSNILVVRPGAGFVSVRELVGV